MKKTAIFKRALSIVTSAVVVASTVLSGTSISYAADSDFKQVVKPDHLAEKQISAAFNANDFGYYFTSSLGTPGYFHIFTSGRYTQTGHVHGNFAAKYYNPNGRDSGIRIEYPVNNVDYAQNIESDINFSQDRDYFIMGSKYTLDNSANQAIYDLTDGTNVYATINNKPYYLAIDKDSANAPFINFEKEQAAMVQKSKTAAAAETTKYLVIDDMNNGGVLLDTSAGDSIYVVDLTYEQIKNWAKIHIKTADLSGVDEVTQEIKNNFTGNTYSVFNYGDTSKTVVINIDMGGNENRTISAQVQGRYDGPSLNGHVTRDSLVPGETAVLLTSCNVLWNLHSNGEAYTGTATFTNNWFGMILAPAAGLFMEVGADGSFICRDFSHRSETHAWYYTGAFPTAASSEDPGASEEQSSSSEDLGSGEEQSSSGEEQSSSSEGGNGDEGGDNGNDEPGSSENPGSGETPTSAVLQFKKMNEAETATLSGAKFVLYGDANCSVPVKEAVVSDANGVVSFGEIDNGTYYLKEEAAPQGYVNSDLVYTVVIAGGVATISSQGANLKGDEANGYAITNDRQKVSIQLIKTYAGENVDVQSLLGDTKFTLYGTYDGQTFENSLGTVSPAWDAVEEKAVVTFRNISVPLDDADIYYLAETQSPGGYTTSDKVFECRVDVNGDVTYRLYNSGEAFTEEFPVCINELEENEEDSSEDTSDSSSEDPSDNEGESSSSSESGDNGDDNSEGESSSSSESGDNGDDSSEGESSSSSESGDNGDDNSEGESSSSSESGDNGDDSSEDESSSSSAPSETIITDIKLIKTNDDGTQLLAGAKFTLYKDANCSEVVTKAVTGQNGVAVLKDIPDGTYFMKETIAPAGYKINEDVYNVKIEQGQATLTSAINASNSVSGNATDGYRIKNYAITSEIRLIKRYENNSLSNEELLRNTEFTLYRGYNGAELSGKVSSANPVWDSARGIAIVSFENVKVPTDGDVIYYLKETKSPTEYTRSNDVYECKIDTEGNVTYRVYGSNDSYSATFPTCNNLLVEDPVDPENPDEDNSEDSTESSDSSDTGSDESSEDNSEGNGSDDSSEDNSEGNGSDNGSEDNSEGNGSDDSSEDNSEGNGSDNSSEDNSEGNGSDNSSEDNSEGNGSDDSSEDNSEGNGSDNSSEDNSEGNGSDDSSEDNSEGNGSDDSSEENSEGNGSDDSSEDNSEGNGSDDSSEDNSEGNGSDDSSEDDSEGNGSDESSDDNPEDDSEGNGSDNSSEEDSEENGSDESSEDNSEDDSDEGSEDDSEGNGSGDSSEDDSEESTEKKKNNKKKNKTSSSEAPPQKELDDVPKTGDDFSVGWLALLVVVSGVAMFFARRAMNKEEYYDISV